MLQKREKLQMEPLGVRAMAIVGRIGLCLFFTVGVVYILVVARALIRGVHADNYASPTWMINYCNR